jgi:hypothetical protein
VVTGRVRWQPAGGAIVDLRARHTPLTATPHLLAAGVVLSEVRGAASAPLVGGLHLRAVGRFGSFAAGADRNRRYTAGAGPFIRFDPLLELGLFAARSAYADPTDAGYFAFERADALEATAYWESERWWPLSIAVDAGAGVERVARFGEVAAGWKPAGRLWSMLGYERERTALRIEVEATESRAGETAAATAAAWRSASLSLSLAIRP